MINSLSTVNFLKEPSMQESLLYAIMSLVPGTVVCLRDINALEYNDEPTNRTPLVYTLNGNFIIFKHLMNNYEIVGCVNRSCDDGNLYILQEGITK